MRSENEIFEIIQRSCKNYVRSNRFISAADKEDYIQECIIQCLRFMDRFQQMDYNGQIYKFCSKASHYKVLHIDRKKIKLKKQGYTFEEYTETTERIFSGVRESAAPRQMLLKRFFIDSETYDYCRRIDKVRFSDYIRKCPPRNEFYKYFISKIYGDGGPDCPFCKSTEIRNIRYPKMYCRNCDTRLSVHRGTEFSHTQKDYTIWMYAIAFLSGDGLTPTKFSSETGVWWPTANRMRKIINQRLGITPKKELLGMKMIDFANREGFDVRKVYRYFDGRCPGVQKGSEAYRIRIAVESEISRKTNGNRTH